VRAQRRADDEDGTVHDGGDVERDDRLPVEEPAGARALLDRHFGETLAHQRRVQEEIVRHHRRADDRNDDDERGRIGDPRHERAARYRTRIGPDDADQLEQDRADRGDRRHHGGVEQPQATLVHAQDRRDDDDSEEDAPTRRQAEEQLRAEHDPGELGDVGRHHGALKEHPPERRAARPTACDQRGKVFAGGDRHPAHREL